ncbi:MAG: TonB-dependent receptor [Opitutus sp.]|nr:TonB-dependent receptor [Opitutus sp.]
MAFCFMRFLTILRSAFRGYFMGTRRPRRVLRANRDEGVAAPVYSGPRGLIVVAKIPGYGRVFQWTLVFAMVIPFVASLPSGRAADAVGVLTGNVSNLATGNLLEGARVSVPALGVGTFTDNTGRFVLAGLPAGTHELLVSYTGLDPTHTPVTVTAGRTTTRNFDLTTGIYKLDAFKVTGEREGGAAAITAQRNADNVRNVVATDSFGNLPNLNAGEVAIRLPGIAGNPDDGGTYTGFTIRGMGTGLNSITLDGGQLTGQGGMARNSMINNFSSTMLEQLELIKGHTPDKGADSLGGTINLKSRSPLNLKEKRRTTYSLGARMAPSFTQQVPMREAHRLHPVLNVAHQEVFDVFGGGRNLGISLNLFYSENVVSYFNTTRDFENTTRTPAYLWDYRTTDFYANRKQGSINLKIDYRLSAATKLKFNSIYNDTNVTDRRTLELRAFTAQTVGTTGTAGILPGYTDRITQVRQTAGSTIEITAGMVTTWNRLRHVDVGAEHVFGPLQLEYSARYSQTHINSGNGGESGTLVHRITNVGWMLDRTQSDLYPRLIQTAGADITNPANYRPTPNGFTNANAGNDNGIGEAGGDARYTFATSFPLFFKSGFKLRDQTADDLSAARRWSYIGAAGLPNDPSILTLDAHKTGLNLPRWESAAFIRERNPITPALWSEDLYFREQTQFTGTRGVSEFVTAGYVMAQGRMGRTGFLTGVRHEKTETESWGWVRARAASSAAQQAADPIGAARRDYAGTRRELKGGYTKSFPSVHLTHDVTSNVKARLSWSTSFGRPALTNLLPNETINENQQTLTTNNPSLLPQTAANWDASLDYYFEPVGNLSVGWFRKTIKDYIVAGINSGTVANGADNGYNGEFGGFTRLSSANAGTAYVQGWELSYQQQFTFLPGVLRGLAFSANYTLLDTHGNFGGAANLTTGQVAGFIPRAANASLSWRHRGLSVRALVNYTGPYLQTYSAASLGRNLYRFKRTITTLGFGYQLRPAVSLTCDIDNLFNEPQTRYRGIPDQMQSTSITGTAVTLGVNGRF